MPVIHWQNYVSSFFEAAPLIAQSKISLIFLDKLIINLFRACHLLVLRENFDRSKIYLRTSVFIDEAQRAGIKFFALAGPLGYINYFFMEKGGRKYLIEGLPTAEHLSDKSARLSDKIFVKKCLKKAHLPTAEGESFSLFDQNKAFKYAKKLGFPLVVKPRFGSMSQHISINIKSDSELKKAVKRALRYSSYFIVERYLVGTDVYRATVVDEKFVGCVKRVPAHIRGDGIHTIWELVDLKNQDPRRGLPRAKDATIFCLVIDETTHRLLGERGYDLSSVPAKNELVFLQEKVILDLGADLFEVTKSVHPDNLELFKKTARLFGVKLVGIDFLAEDIAKSWGKQTAAIIELNNLPYIDMHHFPTEGEPVPIAKYLCDMVIKYY